MKKFKRIIIFGIIITLIFPQFNFAQTLIRENPSYWRISNNRQSLYEGPSTSVKELFRYYNIEKQIKIFSGKDMWSWRTIKVLATDLEGKKKAEKKLKELKSTITLGPKERLVVRQKNKRKILITTVIKYYWARIEKDIPRTDTCLSLLESFQQAGKRQNRTEMNKIKQKMAENNCYIKIRNCVTTKTATREDVQKSIRFFQKGRWETLKWQTIIPGQLKIKKSDSCVEQKIYDYNTLVKKIEHFRQWTSGCGKGCTVSHQEYKGAYLVGCGCTLSGYKYREQKNGKGGRKAGGKGVGKAILTIALAAMGQAWATWSWITFGSSGYGFSIFHLAYVWALIPASRRTIPVNGGNLTLVWCPRLTASNSEGASSGSFRSELTIPKPEVKVVNQNCHSISLEIKAGKAETYSVLRGGKVIASNIPISETIFKDNGLTPHTTYKYKIITKSSVGTSPAAVVKGYTKCFPQCSFKIDKTRIVRPGKATLSWQCQYADFCSISSSIGKEKGGINKKSVSNISGNLSIIPLKTSNWFLYCQNIDGKSVWSVSLKVLETGYKEVRP